MRKILLATAALLAMTAASPAALIDNLGINPTSATGDFSNDPGGGAFSDQYTFQLVGGPLFVTIASATNVYPATTDFIANFSASVFEVVGVIGGGDDLLVLGPASPQSCILVPTCQVVAGSALLDSGSYYLQVSGIGGGTSGYGGNLATFAVPVPGPIVGAGLPGLLAMFGMGGWAWRRRKIAA